MIPDNFGGNAICDAAIHGHIGVLKKIYQHLLSSKNMD